MIQEMGVKERARAIMREHGVPILPGSSGVLQSAEEAAELAKEIGLPVRNTGTYIGHGVDTQFMANLGIGCAVIEHGKLFAPTGSGDAGASPSDLRQVVVTSMGNWRGDGMAFLERVT